jgi:Fic family protein
MSFDPAMPYNDLPLLPPSKEIESKSVLKAAISANRALAALRGLGEVLPNQAILINSLVLQEAKASSQIENIVTTNDALFEAMTSESSNTDPAAKEVLRYREALWAGFRELNKGRPLTTNLFVEIVQLIKKNQAGVRQTPGTTLKNAATGEVMYTPPSGESIIRDKLKNLEDYIHDDDGVDPLIKMSVIHYQFEAIHPFSDGNGRTGRIINTLFLCSQNLLDLPILYLSKYIIDNKADYYSLLREVTSAGEWIPWIQYMLSATEKTAHLTYQKVSKIKDLIEETAGMARDMLPKRVYSRELIELLFHQPYTKAKFLIDAGIAKRQTAADYLKELESVGIMKSHRVGRETLYLNIRLSDLLSDT